MSRVGRLPIEIPSGVTVAVTDGEVRVQGPQGNLKFNVKPGIKVEQKDG